MTWDLIMISWTSKAQATKEKIDTSDLIKIFKKLCEGYYPECEKATHRIKQNTCKS